tara:strand:+ start:499 stop:753 length:255 start_codon:yes stop_codon:yes gene_type:complete
MLFINWLNAWEKLNMNIKLNENEASALMDLIELDTCTDVAEDSWEDTTCAVSNLTKDDADNLYGKLFTLQRILMAKKAKAPEAA